ncbi:MAG: endonuclease/exonuclease/phosphatase family protein [Planctomycetota bacterium]
MKHSAGCGIIRGVREKLAIALVALMLLLAVLPYFGTWAWWLDMLNHFRLQLAVVSLVVAVIVLAVVRKRWASVGLLAVAAHAAPVGWTAFQPDGPGSGASFAHANVGGCDPAAVRAWVSDLDAAAVFLLEVRPEDELARTPPEGWRFLLQRPSDDTRGLIVLVPKWSVINKAHVESFSVPGTIRDMAVVDLGGVEVMQAHLARPGTACGFAEQVAMSEAIADWVVSRSEWTDVLVVGDFNAAPWSAAVKPLRDAGLSPARGGLSGTWPAQLPPGLRVPIDHAFSNRRCKVTVGPDLGGDHRPIVVRMTE